MIDQQDTAPPKKPMDRLSHEIGQVIRDKEFQRTVDKFSYRHETFFRALKAIGIAIALFSGLFGYMLKANSEADDRKAEAIHKVIDKKEAWAIKVDQGILEFRQAMFFIKESCENKAESKKERETKRVIASYELIKSFIGLNEIFGEETYKILLDLTKLDESVSDICAKNAPDDEVWRSYLKRLNKLMHASIAEDRNKINELGKGILSGIFSIF